MVLTPQYEKNTMKSMISVTSRVTVVVFITTEIFDRYLLRLFFCCVALFTYKKTIKNSFESLYSLIVEYENCKARESKCNVHRLKEKIKNRVQVLSPSFVIHLCSVLPHASFETSLTCMMEIS
jgi:hypothetical protein